MNSRRTNFTRSVPQINKPGPQIFRILSRLVHAKATCKGEFSIDKHIGENALQARD